MKKITSALLVSLLSLCLVGTAFAAAPASKIKSFDFLVDYSMSMGWNYVKTGQDRIILAQDLLDKINDRIPSQNYQSGLHLFATATTVMDFAAYSREAMKGEIGNLAGNYQKDRSRLSAGSGLDTFENDYSGMDRPGAVILVTDGDYGMGPDSVASAEVFYQEQPNMCLHIISLANTPEQQAILDGMAALNPCTVAVKAEDLLASDAAIDDFVTRVWGGENVEYRTVVMSANDVHFAFDSAALHESQVKVADTVLADLRNDSAMKVRIDGYTCNTGAPEYNVGLSQRRADALRNYLVDNGIDASRITTAGHGDADPVGDNSTLNGRKMNRRVEFHFFK
ncbi:MAG: OmpA family protein [Deltaproteobacteria bacterium]|jgi:OOP family OmpA-OmpF porin|nr:OmpA family protein [Deltaproteobacteria bacterium]